MVKMLKFLHIPLLLALVGCSKSTSVPEVVYTSSADPGTMVSLSVCLTGNTDQEKVLRVYIEEVRKEYPSGFKPDRVSGHRMEKIGRATR